MNRVRPNQHFSSAATRLRGVPTREEKLAAIHELRDGLRYIAGKMSTPITCLPELTDRARNPIEPSDRALMPLQFRNLRTVHLVALPGCGSTTFLGPVHGCALIGKGSVLILEGSEEGADVSLSLYIPRQPGLNPDETGTEMISFGTVSTLHPADLKTALVDSSGFYLNLQLALLAQSTFESVAGLKNPSQTDPGYMIPLELNRMIPEALLPTNVTQRTQDSMIADCSLLRGFMQRAKIVREREQAVDLAMPRFWHPT